MTMSHLPLQGLSAGWSERLGDSLAVHHCPGAVLGVSLHGDQVVIPAGVANLTTGARVESGTAFQLGSISKIYTATVLGILAERSDLLDRPVRGLLPEAAWLDPDLSARHLLTHTSGLGGDVFTDTGRGDDCLAAYVAELGRLPRDVAGPPGRSYSYCNSGFVLLGRLIEVLGGCSFDEILLDLLLRPLGLFGTTTLPEQTMLGSFAIGHHLRSGATTARPDEIWGFPRAIGPAGGICASAHDVLCLAELHLRGGRTRGKSQLLSEETVAEMARPQVVLPPFSRPSARGLGWGIYDAGDDVLVGHDGETTGQIASLRLLAEEELAVVVATNSIPNGALVAREMMGEVLQSFGISTPPLPAPNWGVPLELERYAGRYSRTGAAIDISVEEGRLRVDDVTPDRSRLEEDLPSYLAPIDGEAFLAEEFAAPSFVVRFSDFDSDGRPRSYFTGRVTTRQASAP
jgi:CubicO group peptidase (beta-lactamase class C family)